MMKVLKRLGCFILALIMLCSLMMVTAFAADEVEYTITINGVTEDASTTYSVYKLLDLLTYDQDSGRYTYGIPTAEESEGATWADFFDTEDAQKYIARNDAGILVWVNATDDTTKATFAQLALAYAKKYDIEPEKSSTNADEFTITRNDQTGVVSGVFSGLDSGYYLVDSNVGALCGLTNTNPHASVNAKNGRPTLDKQVLEDSTNQWGSTNTADIGQTVYFRTTINVAPGAENYVLHDKMDKALTFVKYSDEEDVHIDHIVPGATGEDANHPVPENDYVIYYKDAEDEEFRTNDGCTFEIHFTKELCEKLQANHKLIVYYNAEVNEDAKIGGDGDINEAWLDYGENHQTTHDYTETFTYGFDLVKTDDQNHLIGDGEDYAVFRLYAQNTSDRTPIKFKIIDGKYVVDANPDDENAVADINVIGGQVRIEGLDNGTYYLEEIEAPDGFSKMEGLYSFTIAGENLDAIFNDDVFSTGSGVHIVNYSGTVLPETGGMGTTLFYVCGGALVFAAVVLLITKKRMNSDG